MIKIHNVTKPVCHVGSTFCALCLCALFVCVRSAAAETICAEAEPSSAVAESEAEAVFPPPSAPSCSYHH